MIQDIDLELASAYRKLAEESQGTQLARAEVQFIAVQVRGHISEARRMCAEIEKLGLSSTASLGPEAQRPDLSQLEP